MREKPNPFVSISDLMAGVTAVVMLMLVVMVVRMSVMADAEAKRKQAVEAKRKQGVSHAIEEIRESMGGAFQNVVVTDSVITLSDAAFERGSACLNESIENTLTQKIAAGRAREARKAVLAAVQNDKKISRRIAVVGFGPDRLKNPKRPNAAENRRVEIRLIAGSIK